MNLKAMKVKCPKCKSDFVRSYTKRKYFIKSIACFLVIVLCWVEFIGLLKEDDIDPVIIIGLLGSPCLAVFSLISGVYFAIKGFSAKETKYKCEYCKNKFITPYVPARG
jgi:transposase-like protein